jgi:import receptor subunit TOM22
MVELVEVEDESFETKQTGPEDDDYYTDTGIYLLTSDSSTAAKLT